MLLIPTTLFQVAAVLIGVISMVRADVKLGDAGLVELRLTVTVEDPPKPTPDLHFSIIPEGSRAQPGLVHPADVNSVSCTAAGAVDPACRAKTNSG
jgi:hypothetical protein